MTRLLEPPEEGWRGRFTFIKQILRSAFRVPHQTDPRIRAALDTIDGGARKGGAHAKPARHVATGHVADRPCSAGQARDRSRHH